MTIVAVKVFSSLKGVDNFPEDKLAFILKVIPKLVVILSDICLFLT